MTRINAVALGAALLVGLAGVAGAQTPQTQSQGVKPRAGQQAGPRDGRAFGRGRFGRGFRGQFVKDLNLTGAQKAQIKTIREKYRPQFEAIRTQFKPQLDNARALRQKGDTAGARAAFQKASADLRARVQPLRTQEQSEIRNILTADQRTKWDAAQAQRKKWMEDHQKNGAGFNGRGKYGRGAKPQRG